MTDNLRFKSALEIEGPVTDGQVRLYEAAIDTALKYRAALQQAEMDMGVIWMALPPKEREQLRVARDRILEVLGEG